MKKRFSWITLISAVLVAALVTGLLTYVETASAWMKRYTAKEDGLTDKVALVKQYIDTYFIGEVDEAYLEDETIRGMLYGLEDQWSHYLSKDEFKDYMEAANNEYVGIGVTVLWDDAGFLELTQVSEGSPALEAGLRVGDQILDVDGESVLELGYEATVSAVKGEEGTTVELLVRHPDGTEETVSVERRSIEIVSLTWEMLEDIAYIRIENFDAGVADRFDEALDAALAQGAQGLIFDVRMNPGGQLGELTRMLDRLLPEGPLFRSSTKEQKNAGEESVIRSDADEVNLPMAVLIGEYSYSAAEFFPAALHEYGKAILIGTSTTGKGYAQTPIQLEDGSAIVISIEEYRTPNGVSLAEEGGIDPDVEVTMTAEQLANFLLTHEDDPVLGEALRRLRDRQVQEKAG